MSILDKTISFRSTGKRYYTVSRDRFLASLKKTYHATSVYCMRNYDIFPCDTVDKAENLLSKRAWFRSLSEHDKNQLTNLVGYHAYKDHHADSADINEFEFIDAEIVNEFYEKIILTELENE